MSMEKKKLIEVVERYLEAYNEKDLDGILALYAEDASMEDPVGSEPRSGRAAIREFYEHGFAMGAKVALDGGIRCAGDSVAFPMRASLGDTTIEIIDVFDLDSDGRIARMRAYWSPE